MEGMYIAVCRQCGSEFQAHVTQCIDCGGPTEPRWDGPGMVAPPAPLSHAVPMPTLHAVPMPTLPDDAAAYAVCTADRRGARELAIALAEAGVACRVDLSPNDPSRWYVVCVAPADAERAGTVYREFLAQAVPDGDSLPTEMPTDRCPACGASLLSSALECPECGLAVSGALAGEEETDDE